MLSPPPLFLSRYLKAQQSADHTILCGRKTNDKAISDTSYHHKSPQSLWNWSLVCPIITRSCKGPVIHHVQLISTRCVQSPSVIIYVFLKFLNSVRCCALSHPYNLKSMRLYSYWSSKFRNPAVIIYLHFWPCRYVWHNFDTSNRTWSSTHDINFPRARIVYCKALNIKFKSKSWRRPGSTNRWIPPSLVPQYLQTYSLLILWNGGAIYSEIPSAWILLLCKASYSYSNSLKVFVREIETYVSIGEVN